MAAMGGMGVGIPGDTPGPGMESVDTGGMGVPPVAMNPNEVMLQAMQAVMGKWESGKAQIAGEQNALMQTLMMLAGAQPPGAAEAGVMGGDPASYGMDPMADDAAGLA